jgi:hypothetical protein
MTTRPPLPDPFDYCYEWDGPWGTRKFSAFDHNGRRPDRSVALFKADQMHAYADACVAQETAALREQIEQTTSIAQEATSALASRDRAMDALREAIKHYEAALKLSWPEGAKGKAWEHWNSARAALNKE